MCDNQLNNHYDVLHNDEKIYDEDEQLCQSNATDLVVLAQESEVDPNT